MKLKSEYQLKLLDLQYENKQKIRENKFKSNPILERNFKDLQSNYEDLQSKYEDLQQSSNYKIIEL